MHEVCHLTSYVDANLNHDMINGKSVTGIIRKEHLPLYEIRIGRWRNTQKLRPPPGTPKDVEEQEAWNEEDNTLLEDLKKSMLSEPILRRPNSNERFYLKTDWNKGQTGAALLQPAFEDPKAMKAPIHCKLLLVDPGSCMIALPCGNFLNGSTLFEPR